MAEFKGKVVYATNVASMWGATRREYSQFETLGKRWGDDLVILGFPSLEFGRQEYDDDAKVAEFARSQKFPGILMKIGSVKGKNAPEVWKYMKAESGAKDPTWNFNGKFLVSKTGIVSKTTPGTLESDIDALMNE
jgi:glutathione peroxidase